MPALASVSVETLFAPFEDTTAAFLAFVSSATRSLFTVIYGCHLPQFTDILIEKHKQGVEVGVILDHSQAAGTAERAEVARLIAAGVPILIGTSPVHGQILHSKFTVVDEAAVEFGSWNYSLSASSQSNTVSIIRDAGYARPFLAHYDRLRAFILLHEMAMQPAGEVVAPLALAEDSGLSDPQPQPLGSASVTIPANALSSDASPMVGAVGIGRRVKRAGPSAGQPARVQPMRAKRRKGATRAYATA